MFGKVTLGLAAVGLMHGASAVAWQFAWESAWEAGRVFGEEVVFMWVWYAWTAVQMAASFGLCAMLFGAGRVRAGMPELSNWDLPETAGAARPATRMA